MLRCTSRFPEWLLRDRRIRIIRSRAHAVVKAEKRAKSNAGGRNGVNRDYFGGQRLESRQPFAYALDS
jgi:hypothetical protein